MARLLRKPWHESFWQCVSPHTDAPDNFILWSAISLVGAALKDNVFFETGVFTLYPNQFIVLVGPPGVGKGTAMNLVKGVVELIKPMPVNTLSDRITAERIIERIADGWQPPPKIVGTQLQMSSPDHSCLLFSEELRVLLGASEWMLEFLETAWSQKTFDYQTKNKGNTMIVEMCCSLLAASVPEALQNVQRDNSMVITGGFSSRCLFVYSEQPSKDLPWPEALRKNPKSKDLHDKLALDLQQISMLHGEFKVTTGARVLFENFLKKNRLSASADDSEALANFRARIKAHTLKVAMVLSACRGDELTITDMDMSNAIAEISKVTASLEKLFRGAGDSADSVNCARVQAFIEKHGQTSRKEIMRALHRHIGSMEALDRMLYVLEAIGFCERTMQGKAEVVRQLASYGGKKP